MSKCDSLITLSHPGVSTAHRLSRTRQYSRRRCMRRAGGVQAPWQRQAASVRPAPRRGQYSRRSSRLGEKKNHVRGPWTLSTYNVQHGTYTAAQTLDKDCRRLAGASPREGNKSCGTLLPPKSCQTDTPNSSHTVGLCDDQLMCVASANQEGELKEELVN